MYRVNTATRTRKKKHFVDIYVHAHARRTHLVVVFYSQTHTYTIYLPSVVQGVGTVRVHARLRRGYDLAVYPVRVCK